MRRPEPIIIHSKREFEAMRAAGRLAAETLDMITPHVAAGTHTARLDQLCDAFIRDHGAIPAPLGYRGFPKSICTSINEVVCHGIPSVKDVLKDGDILNIDVTVILEGFHGDTSRMFWVGEPSDEARALCDTTYEAMMLGIAEVAPGKHVGDIGAAIQTFAEKKGYSVVRSFCGHGLGRDFHSEPQIEHYGRRGTGVMLRKGMFFTIEPMINVGRHGTKELADGWTAITVDRKLSAQYEHSIGVTDDGYEIFTHSPRGWTRPPYALG